jgi:hypothetical protein
MKSTGSKLFGVFVKSFFFLGDKICYPAVSVACGF